MTYIAVIATTLHNVEGLFLEDQKSESLRNPPKSTGSFPESSLPDSRQTSVLEVITLEETASPSLRRSHCGGAVNPEVVTSAFIYLSGPIGAPLTSRRKAASSRRARDGGAAGVASVGRGASVKSLCAGFAKLPGGFCGRDGDAAGDAHLRAVARSEPPKRLGVSRQAD